MLTKEIQSLYIEVESVASPAKRTTMVLLDTESERLHDVSLIRENRTIITNYFSKMIAMHPTATMVKLHYFVNPFLVKPGSFRAAQRSYEGTIVVLGGREAESSLSVVSQTKHHTPLSMKQPARLEITKLDLLHNFWQNEIA